MGSTHSTAKCQLAHILCAGIEQIAHSPSGASGHFAHSYHTSSASAVRRQCVVDAQLCRRYCAARCAASAQPVRSHCAASALAIAQLLRSVVEATPLRFT